MRSEVHLIGPRSTLWGWQSAPSERVVDLNASDRSRGKLAAAPRANQGALPPCPAASAFQFIQLYGRGPIELGLPIERVARR
jgi:hypothetical protein